jgi:organic hydroperoxide reductase OsmC/OhrA
MADERDHHVTLRYERGYEFVAEFHEPHIMPLLLLDEPKPLGDGLAPNAAALLGAAIGDCLGASFVFCLRKAHLDIDDLTVRVTTHVARNDDGRFRISGIDVAMDPKVQGKDRAREERCRNLFEDFCVVTESVRHGIPVNVTVETLETVSEGRELA